jgi:hypothetical protein
MNQNHTKKGVKMILETERLILREWQESDILPFIETMW